LGNSKKQRGEGASANISDIGGVRRQTTSGRGTDEALSLVSAAFLAGQLATAEVEAVYVPEIQMAPRFLIGAEPTTTFIADLHRRIRVQRPFGIR
jgi:hypothetical protein